MYHLQGLVVHDATDGCPKVSGIKQHDDSSGRIVSVRYRSPEDEVASYKPPTIRMEFPDISLAYDRMHQSGPINLPYAPEGCEPWWDTSNGTYNPDDSPYRVWEYPVPYNIDYTITVYVRIKRDHLMPILANMEQKIGRYSALNIPQDGTFRRITRLAGPHIGWIPSDDNEKKLFTATYMIRVPTELIPSFPVNLKTNYPRVNTILLNAGFTAGHQLDPNFNLDSYYNEDGLSLAEVQESFGILSVGNPSAWNAQSLNQ